MKFRIFAAAALAAITLASCESALEEEVFSQLDDVSVFGNEALTKSVLIGAYNFAAINGNFGGNAQFQEEWLADQFWETGGAVNQQYMPMSQLTFTAASPTHWTTLWNRFYNAVRNANLVIENADNLPISDEQKALYKAEARFLRAVVYYTGCNLWGGMILKKSSLDPADMARSTAAETFAFAKSELEAICETLPVNSGSATYEYGRATKGAAYAFLCKLCLNTKDWAGAKTWADKVINLGKYSLYPSYVDMFKVENEQNSEYIWVETCSSKGTGNELMCGAYPANFKSCIGGDGNVITFMDNQRNWARMDRVFDSFYESFDPADARRKCIITQYVNASGATVNLYPDGTGYGNTRSFKYYPDVNANGNPSNNDIPVIRYADILLAKAEAINELSGPTQEVLDLIQLVRNRAQLTTPLTLSDYTKQTLRDRIIQERSWEFYGERMRRQDLIRAGKFIDVVKARMAKQYPTSTVVVDDHFLVFPIPQDEVDANSLCEQNPGY